MTNQIMDNKINGLNVYNNSKEVMTSLQIAEITGKQHQHVLRDIDSLMEQGLDASNFGPTSYTDKSNRNQRCYELTKKGCLILASGYDALLREKIINRWEELELNKPQFVIPTTLSGALMLAAKQAEQIEAQQLLIAEQKPKVEFYNDIIDSKDAIDMGRVSKVLNMGIGRNNLFALLRDSKVLMSTNIPYQKYIDLGWFRCIESKYTKPNGDTCINVKTVVFQKGINGIRGILSK